MVGSFVYIIGTSGNPFAVKIGTCRRDPKARLREIQGGCPDELTIMVLMPGDRELEQRLHRTFAPCRIRGEWFAAKGKLEDFIFYLDASLTGERLVGLDQVGRAISDILFNDSRHPRCELSQEDYDATVDLSVWPEFADAIA